MYYCLTVHGLQSTMNVASAASMGEVRAERACVSVCAGGGCERSERLKVFYERSEFEKPWTASAASGKGWFLLIPEGAPPPTFTRAW